MDNKLAQDIDSKIDLDTDVVINTTSSKISPLINGSNLRQVIYFSLALAGLVLTQQANWQFIQTYGGFKLAQFVTDAASNAAGQSLSWDLAIGATAILIWMITESKRIGMKHSQWPILISISVAFAAGAPLFLALRERHLNRIKQEESLEINS